VAKKKEVVVELDGAIIGEVVDAADNYIQGVSSLDVASGTSTQLLTTGAEKHTKRIEAGNYSFDNLVLEQVYLGLAKAVSDIPAARDHLIAAAAATVAAIQKLDAQFEGTPAEEIVEEEIVPDLAPNEGDPADELDEEAFSHASEAFADLADDE
jgi:hypothetical protein